MTLNLFICALVYGGGVALKFEVGPSTDLISVLGSSAWLDINGCSFFDGSKIVVVASGGSNIVFSFDGVSKLVPSDGFNASCTNLIASLASVIDGDISVVPSISWSGSGSSSCISLNLSYNVWGFTGVDKGLGVDVPLNS